MLSDPTEDLRGTILYNRKRKMESTDEELRRTKDALSKVECEMSIMRSEMEKLRSGGHEGESNALGFVPSTFMALNCMVALSWVSDTVVPEMRKEMEKFPKYFEKRISELPTGAGGLGIKCCLKFNRGEECGVEWHVHSRPKKNGQGYRKELRLHCCVLCKEALDVVACHNLLKCPWISLNEWRKVKEMEKIAAN